MTKKELDARVERKYYAKHCIKVQGVSDIMLNHITQTLCLGKRIEIRGFGAWFLRLVKPRTMQNPKTMERLAKKTYVRVMFKASRFINTGMLKNVDDEDEEQKNLGILPADPEPLIEDEKWDGATIGQNGTVELPPKETDKET